MTLIIFIIRHSVNYTFILCVYASYNTHFINYEYITKWVLSLSISQFHEIEQNAFFKSYKKNIKIMLQLHIMKELIELFKVPLGDTKRH